MMIEHASETLKELGERLFAFAREHGGGRPTRSGDWYRVSVAGRPALYLRFVGTSARRHPRNSIHLATAWSDSLALIDGVRFGNNWYGQPSADMSARPGHPLDIANAEDFVRRAIGTRGPSPRPIDTSTHRQDAASVVKPDAPRRSFPLTDRRAILKLAGLYWSEITANEAAEERRFEKDFLEARALGYVPRELFLRVARWKSVRQTANYERNTDAEIRDATTCALRFTDDRAALAALMTLKGVALRTASAILHWLRPDRFPILDVRVVAALAEPTPRSFEDLNFYVRIAHRIRELSVQHRVDLRTLDRALWTWDRLSAR